MRRRFRGQIEAKIDAKGRVSIPPAFRRVIEAGDPDWDPDKKPTFVIVYGIKERPCLEAYTLEGISSVEEKIEKLPPHNATREKLERIFLTQSTDATVDETGRIVMDKILKARIGEASNIIFAGLGEKFRIWSTDDYAKDTERMDAETGGETVAELIAEAERMIASDE